MQTNVLLTGVTGLIGRHVLYELLSLKVDSQFHGRIYLILRPGHSRGARARVESLLKPPSLPTRLWGIPRENLLSALTCIEADIREPELKAKIRESIPAGQWLQVVHSAASTNLFSHPDAEQEVYSNNYLGTRNLLKALAGRPHKFVYISTAFSAGIREGKQKDGFLSLDSTVFRNPYERYKRKTEQELLKYGERFDVEIQILRPSVVCGRLLDSPLYFVSSYAVFYGFAKFFWALKKRGVGETVRIRIHPDAGLNIVPVDYAAKAIVRALPKDIEQLNIVHSATGRLRSMAAEILSAVGYENYVFASELPENPNRTERLFYKTVDSAFHPYLCQARNEFDNSRLRQLMRDIPEPDAVASVKELIRFALEWGFEEGISIEEPAIPRVETDFSSFGQFSPAILPLSLKTNETIQE